MKSALIAALMLAALPARAQEGIVTYKALAPDLALDLARAAMHACRDAGYQVAVVVLDRTGQPQALARDRFAGLPAPTTATDKAYTALGFGKDTSELARSIQSGALSPGLAALPRVTMLAGGVVIEVGGSVIGAVGVAGAPGGDKDEACARAGLDVIRDKLDF